MLVGAVMRQGVQRTASAEALVTSPPGSRAGREPFGCSSTFYWSMVSESGEKELLERCRSGDHVAMSTLFRRYYPRALRVAFGVIGDRHLAEDAVQEAFLGAVRSSAKLQPGVPFDWWLLRSVIWASRSQARRRRRPDLHLGSQSVPPDRAAPSHEADVDARLVVLSALAELPLHYRETVVARFYLQMSEPEAAIFLGCRLGTVKSRTSRALRALGKNEALTNACATVREGKRHVATQRIT